ncbi:MAG TPA: cation-transporting P-type ATPase [Solirubrobacteraceae bacterium]|nr:cation-transporting P-type ATPase [Solirubrobacteraceae bacterium]
MATLSDHPSAAPIDAEPDPQAAIDRLYRRLAARPDGLSSREVERRLVQYGPNTVTRTEGSRWVGELVRQFVHPLAVLLWLAAALSWVSGGQTLALAIVAVIVLNAALAFIQERQAERATEALGALLPTRCRVRRDGAELDVEAGTLVPGDVLLLAEGDRISADARLVSGQVEVDIAALTGESAAVTRSAGADARAPALLDAEDLVFAGTMCTAGEAVGLVYATGMTTQLGRIAALSQRLAPETSPLQRQVNRAAWLIAAIGVGVASVFFVIGSSLAGLTMAAAVTFAIGLLVANVPEGLLPTITLSLAGGVRRMAAHRALVKRLTAVETLGSTDVICTDKTGTLTEGTMTVRAWWTLAGVLARDLAPLSPLATDLLATATFCNNATLAPAADGAWRGTGDSTEVALLISARALGFAGPIDHAERGRQRSKLYSFDARRKRMTTLDAAAAGWTYHVKGAPLELLSRCTAVADERGVRGLSAADRERVAGEVERSAASGLRVLGFASRVAPGPDGEDRDVAEAGLTFLGLAALDDPPRPEVPAAIAVCRRAGIRIVMITGDDGRTATAVAREVGIVTGEPTVISGAELDAMGQEERDDLLHRAQELIVARSNPETKLHIVDALRAQGHTVAMTGDGVNDAPALRRADIGVAMGASGTDVAREAATMVLTDDNFASIVRAIEEGRVVYDNIRKFITYIFVHAVPEVVPFMVFALSGGLIPLPLTALQVLAIDLGSDTVPALALGREPGEPGTMTRPPRPRESGIISRAMLMRAWLRLGVLEALLVLGGFFLVMLSAGWAPGDPTGPGARFHVVYQQATTMSWAGIVAGQIGAAFAVRSTYASWREVGPLRNPHLLRGVAFALGFAAVIIYAPPAQALFHTRALPLRDLLVLASFTPIVWASDELWRRRLRRRAA